MTKPPDPDRPAPRDVRSRGFAARADVEDVERFLAAKSVALPPESAPLLECAGRVLAEDICAAVSVPSFARSAMDGFALRGEDSFGASDYDPIRLKVLGQSLPGRPFCGRVGVGEAVRIMTGAPLPEGADAVAMAEVCREQAGRVAITEPVAPHKSRSRTKRSSSRRSAMTVIRLAGVVFIVPPERLKSRSKLECRLPD